VGLPCADWAFLSDGSCAPVAPQYGATTETRAAPGLVSRHGKLEKSLLSFKAVNPAWSPRGAAKEYLERLEVSAVEYAAATARSGFPSGSPAHSQRSDKGAGVAGSAAAAASGAALSPAKSAQASATIASLSSIHEDETAGALAMHIFGRVGGAYRWYVHAFAVQAHRAREPKGWCVPL